MKVVIFSLLAMLGCFQLTKVVWNSVTAPHSTGIIIDIDTSQAPDLAEFGARVKADLEKWYTPIKALLFSDEYRGVDRVRLFFDPKYKGIAYAIWEQNLIVASVDFYRKHPKDLGSLIHELVHIIQQYPWSATGICPRWLAEGLADWIRYYIYEPHNKPSKPWAQHHYTNGYIAAAYFLDFLNSKLTRREDLNGNLTSLLNTDCRAGKYSNTTIKNLLGKNADELWSEMMSEPTHFIVQVNTSDAPEMSEYAARIKTTLEHWYPYFAKILYSLTFQHVDTIKVLFVKSLGGAIGYRVFDLKIIAGAADRFRENQDEMGYWVKNMVYIVQQYHGTTCPDWVKSGIMDWAWYWHVEPHRKPGKPRNGLNYTRGWGTSAYFLNWLNERNLWKGRNVTYWLNRWCREDTFNDDYFPRLTGRTLDEHWEEMMRS